MKPSTLILAGAVSSATASTNNTLSSSAIDNTGVFVHLFEWPHSAVADECENYLGPKGFNAVQVSPPMEHIQGDTWWTRYQPVSYKLVSRSGNEDEFRDMVKRCAAVGVDIVADGVTNHMAAGSGTGTAGTSYGNRNYEMYSQEDFHHGSDMGSNCQVSDYTNQKNVQECDLVSLPDLDTSSSYVQETLAGYLNGLYDMGVKGFRIDAAKHQEASQLNGYLSKLPDDAFVFGEVIAGAGEAVSADMYTDICSVTEFDWVNNVAPNVQAEGKMKYLKTVGESWGIIPSDVAVIFTDNHDTQRGNAPLTYKDGDLYKVFNIFMLAHPYGYPKVMSSYYFSDHDAGPPGNTPNADSCGDGNTWVCEHRWREIGNMANWRKAAGNTGVITNWSESSDGNGIAFGRGGSAFVAINRNGNNYWQTSVSTGMPAGTYCNVMQSDDISSCETITVDGNGMADINVPSMGAVAFHSGSIKA